MKRLIIAVGFAASISACAGGGSSPTSSSQSAPAPTPAPVPTPTPAPVYPNMVGSWTGTATNSALGISSACNLSWLIPSQSGGSFSGTFQLAGAVTGCSEAGTFSGTVTPAGAMGYARTAITVGNGTICTDANITVSGIVSGATLTLQLSFTRTCTSPALGPFPESQTFSLAKH